MSFKKELRLKGKRNFDKLFEVGLSTSRYPLKLIWCELDVSENVGLKIGVAVPKKRFPKAIDRNKLKRRMRESIRKHLQEPEALAKESNKSYALLFIYIGKETLRQSTIEMNTKKLLRRWTKNVKSLSESDNQIVN